MNGEYLNCLILENGMSVFMLLSNVTFFSIVIILSISALTCLNQQDDPIEVTKHRQAGMNYKFSGVGITI